MKNSQFKRQVQRFRYWLDWKITYWDWNDAIMKVFFACGFVLFFGFTILLGWGAYDFISHYPEYQRRAAYCEKQGLQLEPNAKRSCIPLPGTPIPEEDK